MSRVEAGPMVPTLTRVVSRRVEGQDTVTIDLEPIDDAMAAMRPGQFNMLWAPGVGEVPISVSGGFGTDALHHTIRDVGAVTAALCALRPGASVGVRGPFGTDWGIDDPSLDGQHALLVAGGVGLAPLRGAVEAASRPGARVAACSLVVGARTPDAILYAADLDRWAGAGRVDVRVTVDRAADGWTGPVGLVTELLPAVLRGDGDRAGGPGPDRTVAFVCGPEIMMVRTAEALVAAGVPAPKIRLSLERNMKCAVAMCGHCQLGAELVCHDGPVFTYDRVAPLLRVAER